jgi:hypothetical protein
MSFKGFLPAEFWSDISLVEAAGGKPQRAIDVARRDVMTQL